MTALVLSLLLIVIMMWAELRKISDPKPQRPPRYRNKAVKYSNFDSAARDMRDIAYLGWEVVSHSVSPDGSWYVVYKQYYL